MKNFLSFLQKFSQNFEIRESCKKGNFSLISPDFENFCDSLIWTNHCRIKLSALVSFRFDMSLRTTSLDHRVVMRKRTGIATAALSWTNLILKKLRFRLVCAEVYAEHVGVNKSKYFCKIQRRDFENRSERDSSVPLLNSYGMFPFSLFFSSRFLGHCKFY